jgi:hypothetical protein
VPNEAKKAFANNGRRVPSCERSQTVHWNQPVPCNRLKSKNLIKAVGAVPLRQHDEPFAETKPTTAENLDSGVRHSAYRLVAATNGRANVSAAVVAAGQGG